MLALRLGVHQLKFRAHRRPGADPGYGREVSDPRLIALIVALGAAMVISAVLGARQRLAAAVLALLSFVWLLVDEAFEGPRLLLVTTNHGLVSSDLVGLIGLVLAGILLVRPRG